MKRKFLLGITILTLQTVAYPQQYFGIKLGANHPLSTSQTARRLGSELGFVYGRQVQEQLYFETGLVVEGYGRRKPNAVVNNYWMQTDTVDASFLRLSAYIPLHLNYRIARFELKGGFLIYCGNALTFTTYTGFDPECAYLESGTICRPKSRTLSIETNIAVGYRLTERLNLYANYRPSIGFRLFSFNTFSDYSLLSGGVQYIF